MSLHHRISAVLLVATLAGCGSKSTAHVEPLQPAPALGKNIVAFEFVGEADVAKNQIRIRPALPSEIPANSPALKSWSQISSSGSGSPSGTLAFATYGYATGPGEVDTTGTSNRYPASYTCAAGHQCGWISITQAAGTTLKFGNAVAAVYNITNGVTLANGESPPSPASSYSSALPAGAATMRYPGGPAWSSFRWGNPAGTTYMRAWDFDLHSAPSFTFQVRVWGVVDRAYSSFTGPTGITSFTDACSIGTSYFSYSAGTGQSKAKQTINLDFPFSLYDSNGTAGPATVQSLQFQVDGALTMTDDIGLVGARKDTASIVASGLAKYAILPFYSNLTTAAGGGQLCYASAGTTPSRTAIFTWKGVRFEADTSKAATFSAILHENTDIIDFQFASVNAAITTATSGVRKDDTTYVCTLTASGCVTDLITSGANLNMVQYTLTPSDPTYAGP
jgi:hypothetical protein